ncbi:MAG TPA: gene transfer agent family protein [Beijerinckiaceae bacterium]|jgi:hypothetical protein
MSETAVTLFFGDRERVFDLAPDAHGATYVLELERVTAKGVGTIASRMFSPRPEFHLADLHETIRLALIGGGADPEEAAALVKTYAVPQPVSRSFDLALQILSVLWFGQPVSEAA